MSSGKQIIDGIYKLCYNIRIICGANGKVAFLSSKAISRREAFSSRRDFYAQRMGRGRHAGFARRRVSGCTLFIIMATNFVQPRTAFCLLTIFILML